jgi:glycosyltransferase involved in cell wall biosynthesis
MIRVLHYVSGIWVGGIEQLLIDFCRYRDPAQFECAVASTVAGVIADELRQMGVSVTVGPTALQDSMCEADLLNLHWSMYEPEVHACVKAAGKPYLITLHCPSALPELPVVKICTSERAREVQEDQEQCVVILNGVDLSRFGPRCDRQREEVILTRVCRPPKCAFYFWPAMKQVLSRYPQARLWIVGNEFACVDTAQVRFLGVRRDVPEILAETDIFVYTPEPGSGSHDLVVMEAAAAGVPCVVTDVSAVRPSVKDGVTGFLTRFGSGPEFVEKVGLLVENAELRARMSCAATQLARERFDIREVVRRYEVVYRAVLDGSRRCTDEGMQYRPSQP